MCTWMFGAALFITSPNCKQPRCSSKGYWINKLLYKHTMEYYSAKKKKKSYKTEKRHGGT